MNKIDEIIHTIQISSSELHLDDWTLDDVRQCMKEYAEWYANKCLLVADDMFDWDHDLEEWTSDYKPSEIDLPEHD